MQKYHVEPTTTFRAGAIAVLALGSLLVNACRSTEGDDLAARRKLVDEQFASRPVWKTPILEEEPIHAAPVRSAGTEADAAPALAADSSTGDSSTGDSAAAPHSEALTEPRPDAGATRRPDLVEELRTRSRERWNRLLREFPAEPGDGGGSDDDSAGWNEEGLASAIDELSAGADSEEQLIMTALYLRQNGRKSESDRILRALVADLEPAVVKTSAADESSAASGDTAESAHGESYEPANETAPESGDAVEHEVVIESVPDSGTAESEATSGTEPSPTPAPVATSFALESVGFAAKIDGPGEYDPLPPERIRPGAEVLIYGEFSRFSEDRVQQDPDDEPQWERAFAASLRLKTKGGDVLDELDFLPADSGRQLVTDRTEPVNFWARYRIPDSLAGGEYKIEILASDLIGDRSATTALPFELPARENR